jgi:hypothetical protein
MREFIFFQNNRIKLSFAWYDLWIGLFVDAVKRKIYFCPVPTILFTLNY